MKNRFSRFFFTIVFSLFFLIGGMTTTGAHAQSFESLEPMPAGGGDGPPLPPGHGHEDDQLGAPIGGGLLILLSFAGAYGAAKVYKRRRRLQE